MDQVPLISKDGTKFIISRKSSLKSKYFQTILEGFEQGEIQLDYDKDIVQFVVNYLNLHENDEPNPIKKPLQSINLAEAGVSQQNIEFLNTIQNPSYPFKLLNAAAFLKITGLIDLVSAKIATLFMNQTSEEIAQKFNINDPLPEDFRDKAYEMTKWMTLSH